MSFHSVLALHYGTEGGMTEEGARSIVPLIATATEHKQNVQQESEAGEAIPDESLALDKNVKNFYCVYFNTNVTPPTTFRNACCGFRANYRVNVRVSIYQFLGAQFLPWPFNAPRFGATL